MRIEEILDPTPKYIVTPDSCMWPSHYGNANDRVWLDAAVHLDASLISLAPDVKEIVDGLFDHILKSIEADGTIKKPRAKKALYRLKQTNKAILLNLYVAYWLGLPVRYSRDRNRYGKNKRYGKLFFKYSRVIATAKAFKELGLIEEKPWVNDREKGFGRMTRMWATPKLRHLFHQVKFHQPERVAKEDRTEIIELRDEEKNSIGYAETKEISSMRERLLSYNDFIDKQVITVAVGGNEPISLYYLENRIYSGFITGDLSLTGLVINKYLTGNVRRSDKVDIYMSTEDSSNSYLTQTNFNFTNIASELERPQYSLNLEQKYTSSADKMGDENPVYLPLLSIIIKKHLHLNRSRSTSKIKVDGKNKMIFNEKRFNELNKRKLPLFHFGTYGLNFNVNSKKLHRVFNRGSFDCGGRFYGDYQVLPKGFRQYISINGEPTVELDYSAHHIRIAYNLEGIDYKDDPYLAITDNAEERKIFKLLLLVILNAENEDKAVAGFRNKNRDNLRDLLGDLKDSTLRPLIARVKDTHPKIANYIHSDAGVRLQNIDSQITDSILTRLTDQGIPCLPIHDSYIVPVSKKEQLRQAMMEEYEQVMKFRPVIGGANLPFVIILNMETTYQNLF